MATERCGEGQDGGTYGSTAAAERRRRGAAARSQHLGPITERMLELAGVGPGSRVLDVAAGTGEQTLVAAQRVGPNGSVLAIDIAASMLAVAAEAAREAGLSNVETRVMDARDLQLDPESFDAAICRLGLMLIPERDKAMLGIRAALKPGGRLAAVVLAAQEQNAFNALPLEIAHRHAGRPYVAKLDPGRFALSEPEVFRALFERAGFREVVVETITGQQRFASVATAVEYRLDSSPDVVKLLADLGDQQRAEARTEIEAVARRFAGPDGVVIPSEWLVGAGTR